jgi:hypothetical protein
MLGETTMFSRSAVDRENELKYRLRLDTELRPALAAKRRELERQVAAELRERSGSG